MKITRFLSHGKSKRRRIKLMGELGIDGRDGEQENRNRKSNSTEAIKVRIRRNCGGMNVKY